MSYAKDQDPASKAGQAAPVTRAPRAEGNETAATGHGTRVMRRLDVLARSSAEHVQPPRLHLTPGHGAVVVRAAAWMEAAGDAVDRYETRVVAVGTPFRVAETTNPPGDTTV